MPDNAHEHTTVTRDNYQITFHPGFSSRSTVKNNSTGTETELYRQEGVYNLPAGQTKPPTRHEIRLTGGPQNRNVALSVDDPKHEIARIIVEFYAEGREPGWGNGGSTEETLTVQNDGTTCPPDCDNPGG